MAQVFCKEQYQWDRVFSSPLTLPLIFLFTSLLTGIPFRVHVIFTALLKLGTSKNDHLFTSHFKTVKGCDSCLPKVSDSFLRIFQSWNLFLLLSTRKTFWHFIQISLPHWSTFKILKQKRQYLIGGYFGGVQ